MKKLIANAKIFNKNNQLINVHILIENGKISNIYNEKNKIEDILTVCNPKIIDANNNLVLSGFINSHSSLLKKFFYEKHSFDSFNEFNEQFEDFKNKLTEEEKYLTYKYEILNSIKNGITTICDEDFYNLPLKKAVLETKCRIVYKVGIKNCFECVDETLIKKLNQQNANFILGLNNVLFNNEDNFSKMINLSKTYDRPVFCNSSFSLFEAGEVDTSFNSSTINLLNNYGFLDYDNILFGANVLDKEDYNILKYSDVNLLFSPSFNLSFGFESANIYALNKNNKIGLSSFKNDYFLEMFLLKNLENNNYDKLNLFDYFEIFEKATKNNAEILKQDFIGEIKVGNFADLVIYDIKNLISENQILQNLNSSNIISTIINGEEVYNKNIQLFNSELIKKINNIK